MSDDKKEDPSNGGRDELLLRARSFLTSPQVQHQGANEKRTFLREKGVSEKDIDHLLSEIPAQAPSVPPRTYPQLRPSNLPVLLLGLARLFSSLAGASAILVFIYHRFLLPRITQTALAKRSIRSHHVALLRRMTTSLASLKESQAESFAVLPRADPSKEDRVFKGCSSIADILALSNDKEFELSTIPTVTLLRCGLADFARSKEQGVESNPTTQELFMLLEERIPWLVTEEGLKYQQSLWDTLTHETSLFTEVISESPTPLQHEQLSRWQYITPVANPPPPLVGALDELSQELQSARHDTNKHMKKTALQHTLQSLSDFTGYISTQVYMPYRPMGAPSGENNTHEEEFKREIRALKGLVLNRRTFMPTIPRQTSLAASTP